MAEIVYLEVRANGYKRLILQNESARARPGSPNARNEFSACCSVVTYETVAVVRQESRPGWFTWYHGAVLVLDSSVVRVLKRKTSDPGSSPDPGQNFSLSILQLANQAALV